MQPGEKFVRCLLDQKDEEGRRARRLRRRTLLISILIQVLVLTLLLLRPLFGAEEVHLVARLVPLPPYRGGSARPAPAPHRPARPRAHQRDVVLRPILLFPSPRKHPVPAEGDTAPDIGPAIGIPGLPGPGNPTGLIPFSGMAGDSRPLPPPPPASEPKRSGPRRVPSEVQEAKLLERIEPQYPALARQAHLQGTVELHAIIARDGSIQSVEIVSGNVILATAARDAVMRWRYRPTLLNGQPVEVETFIHVVFKMP
jgi:protein TonB